MKVVRFLLEIDSTWKSTITSDVAGPAWSVGRELRKITLPNGKSFPLPPVAEMPAAGDIDGTICNDQNLKPLEEMYGRLVNRKPVLLPQSDIEVFGRYLFRTLLGQAAWQSILTVADANQADSIELALSWDPGEHDLHRLNWEMMHGPDGFLARGRREAGKIIPIGIVRMVRGSTAVPRALGLPPRLLFVVHSDVTDERIRPAAEIMGLLERLEREGRGFHREVLRNSSASLLRAKVKAFQPDVVHFICHGETDAAGRGFLILKDEQQKKDEPTYAVQLVDLISAAGSMPSVVVLSACKSGGVDERTVLGGHAVAPLAAELVQRGVPVVVGMGGRIADRACRLFTLGFGVGLLSGKPLLAAITAGRCAAFAEGAPPHKSADWAFPAVFLSAKVPSDYVAATTSPNDGSLRLSCWLRNLQLARSPVFCARDDFFDSYQALLGPGEAKIRPAVLGIHIARNVHGFGRKRLLQELAAQAVRDGHLPLLLTSDRQDGTLPQDALALALELVGAADRACQVLTLPEIEPSQVLLLQSGQKDIPALAQNPALARSVKRRLVANPVITAEIVKLALQADLTQLAQAFRAQRPPGLDRPARIVVLLNRVELFGDALTTSLLYEWADASGLGTPEEPIPVIFTFALGTAADHIFNKWIADASSRPWIIERALKPFAEGEDLLAYQRVFMNPFHPNLLPGVSDQPLAINEEADAKIAGIYEEMFRLNGEGMPGALVLEKTFAIAKSALSRGYLVPMQDSKWFEEIFARR